MKRVERPPILLTGFEPFGGDALNPSQEIVRALDGEIIGGHRIVGAVLPVAFASAPPLLDELIEHHRPVLVLALGLAGGRGELSFERVAVNLIDARIPDNDGAQPIDAAVIDGAPPAYFSTLPLKAIVADLRARSIPAGLSLSAGSFVCNAVFFGLAHRLATHAPRVRGGFVHVPWLPEQAARHPGQPSMAQAIMIDGIRAALACAIAVRDDLCESGGTIA